MADRDQDDDGGALDDDENGSEEGEAPLLSVRDLIGELERPSRSTTDFIRALCRSHAPHDRGVAALALYDRIVSGGFTAAEFALLRLALRDELIARAARQDGSPQQPQTPAEQPRIRFKLPHPLGQRTRVEVEVVLNGSWQEEEFQLAFFWCGVAGDTSAGTARDLFALTSSGLTFPHQSGPTREEQERGLALIGEVVKALFT